MYDDGSINTEKYSKVISEIGRFIDATKEKPMTIKGNVEEIDLNSNILTVKLQPTKQPDLSRGSSILIREDAILSVNVKAIVTDIYSSTLKIEIKTNPSQFENKKVVIDANITNVILERLSTVIENIKGGKINLDNVRILDFIIGENKPQYSKEIVSFISKKLNENQKEAVTKSIEADDFHLVIGPPGTGKTSIIEELIKQFSRRNQKILITAWSNSAVDNVIKRLVKKEAKKVVRIGPINKIDPKVRKYSIFEKMKRHKDWKEVETYHKIIDNLFKSLSEVKDRMNLVQENISQTMDKVKIRNEEFNNLIDEEQKYKKMISTSINNENLSDISPINNKMVILSQESETFSSLSKNILQMNELQTKIPEIEYIQSLKNLTRNMKFSILRKKVSSFLFHVNNKELEKLKQEYEKNKTYLDEISDHQKKCNNLRKICEKDFSAIYPDEDGHPDEDALNLEFKIYKILENQYLPILKKQETSNSKRQIAEINQEVYRIYLESLRRQIDLVDTEIKGLNTELYIKINHGEDLHRQHTNLLSSIDLYKKKVNKLIKAIISEIINNADLIAATAISSYHYFLDDIKFDVMIMDEASQVASFMSLLPLSKCNKFILVGDNKQLQPIEEEDISKEMNLSIFNRFFEMYPNASTLLTTQYRMHKSIAQIASEIFYEGKLRTSKNIAESTLNLNVGKHQFLNPAPVLFIDTSKGEYYEDGIGSGCSNIKEANYVAYTVSLFIKNGIKTKNIGVVTPYVKQKVLIKKFLKDIEIKDVEVNTVHGFQGREKDIMIMSFARSKKYSFPQYKLRFIEIENLINVAITRAKKKLILIGNSKTLRQSKLLEKVISKVGRKNTVIL
ncbi:MAG: AAA family ATPase [Nanoarchaeota archaeon]|nr:AAA family ATPase [Nanoarchaeota archaeon]MBU1135508.1 AAA family ATPase [Nanoarchaeota archaeon]MBU2520298.1 AAA family ATPase [Nanoarchaeota archaeon]